MINVIHEQAIEVRGLTKRYSSNIACNNIHLTVRSGTTFGLLGPNGAGKSTLIRMLMGLLPSDAGQATILGFDRLRAPELRHNIGYVPELHYIYRWMTVREVLDFVSQLYERWDCDLAAGMFEKFELPPTKRVSSLSKGMTAKLGLLLALAYHPELLILDEPTSGLDPIIREDFLESVLHRPIGSNRTVLFSSHHVDDVERVSDEVGIMVQGSLVVQGSPDELRQRIKRIRGVLKDGKLPMATPQGMLSQKLSRREWTFTVDHYSEELIEQIELENDLLSVEAIDLNLEEIFKDVVRGLSNRMQEAGK